MQSKTLDIKLLCDKIISQSNNGGRKNVKKNRRIELTEDPLTNINLMVPLLNDRAREAVSYFIYGCCVGESISKVEDEKDKET